MDCEVCGAVLVPESTVVNIFWHLCMSLNQVEQQAGCCGASQQLP